MAKIIEKENGEWIIAGDDVPEDLVYHEDYKKTVSLETAAENLKKNILEPVSVLITFAEEELQTIPVQIQQYSCTENKAKVSGIILTQDFAFVISKMKEKISKVELVFEDKRVSLIEECSFKKIRSKDMNMVTVSVDLFITKHI